MKNKITPFSVPKDMETTEYERILAEEVSLFEKLKDNPTFVRMLEEIEQDFRSKVIDGNDKAIEYRNMILCIDNIHNFISSKLNLTKTFKSHVTNKKKV